MKLYMRQKVFSWVDKFTVKDEYGQDKYHVEGEFFTIGKKLHVYDMSGVEIAYIHQKVLSFLPRFFVFVNGQQIAEIVKKLSFLTPKYCVNGLGWEMEGDFLAHDYQIYRDGGTVVTFHKKWMTWGDCYEIDIADENDELAALSVVLAVDCVMAASSAGAGAGAGAGSGN